MGKSSNPNDQPSHGTSSTSSESTPILSKKQQRAAKKAAKKLEALQKDPEALKAWNQQQAKAQRKREDRAIFQQILKEEREEHKLQQKKKRNRQLNSKNPSSTASEARKANHNSESSPKNNHQRPTKKANTTNSDMEDVDISHKVLKQMKQGTTDGDWTILERGVKYKDVTLGKGLREVSGEPLVTVKYAVRGAQSATIIDSSNNFKFRVGKGEVIQGFDMAVMGMREGGRRHVLVPPKAGYGSQDIGAGPGALLHFDITLLNIQVRARK